MSQLFKAVQQEIMFGTMKQKELDALKYNHERMMDFLEWLFDNEMNHTTLTECWDLFEKFEEQHNAVR